MKTSKLEIDIKEGTAYLSGVSYFFRSQFADGIILAFYSHSPWGRCEDMEKGWVLIDPTKKIILDKCATRSFGFATGEYREWIKGVREEHGKTAKTFRDESGDYLWKMEE